MRCERCGVRLGPEAEYCPVCGTRVRTGEEERPAYVPRHMAPEATEPDDGDDGDGAGVDDPDDVGDLDDVEEPDELDAYLDQSNYDERAFDDERLDDVPVGSRESGPWEYADGEPAPWEFEDDDDELGFEPGRPHPASRVLTVLAVAVGVVVMVMLSLPMTSSPSGRAPVVFSTPATLYPSEVASAQTTQREILERASELGIDARTNWTPTFGEDGCLTDASAQQATDLLNLYRFVAGVEPVGWSPASDERAQAVVDVYAGTEFQAHTLTERPADMDAATFAMAQDAAQRSNVGVGYGNWGQDLPAYIAEVDPNPIQPNYETVGHRRHLLGTSLADVGFGLNGPYSAIYVGEFDGSRIDETVAWPACETPLALWVQGSPWSVSLPYAIEDDEAVGVSVTRLGDGRVWDADDMEHLFIDHGSYHDASAVVFTPRDLEIGRDDGFEVSVEGLPNGTLTYGVRFFDMGFELR